MGNTAYNARMPASPEQAAADLARAQARIQSLTAEYDRLQRVRTDLEARATGFGWYIAALRIVGEQVRATTRALPVRQLPKRGQVGAGTGFRTAREAAGREWHGKAGDAFSAQMQRLDERTASSSHAVDEWAQRQADECTRAADAAQAIRNRITTQLYDVNVALLSMPSAIEGARRSVRQARANVEAVSSAATGGR